MKRHDALKILHEHVKNKNLIKHMIAAEAVMSALAKEFGQDQEQWALAGLLHDVDWEETQTTPELHTKKSKEYLVQAGVDPKVVQAIYIHNHVHGITPKTALEKALYCAEELTGLIVACALVQPDKKLSSVQEESVIKKFNQPSFAAGVNREIVLQCHNLLGMSLEELISLELKAMQEIAHELGL